MAGAELKAIQDLVLSRCDASAILKRTKVQSLWSDFGEIVRLELAGGTSRSLILKRVQPPTTLNHPRGWSNNTSTDRKLRSYEVEACWYEGYAAKTPAGCRVPKPVAVERQDAGLMILMEDLDGVFPKRHSQLSVPQACTCLSWLAAFHAHHLGLSGEGLWPMGTYWHLDTRQDEYAAMADGAVKEAAEWLDDRLRSARFQTLVHGDAKVANFCFSKDSSATAAVDFQYVGRGPGIRDVAYFLGSCLSERALSDSASQLLDHYFRELQSAVSKPSIQGAAHLDIASAQALEDEWRTLYPVAWVDFYRFLLGWAPEHQKINAYTRMHASDLLG